MVIGTLTEAELARRLARDGLRWGVGPFNLHLRTPLPGIAPTLRLLYAHHPLSAEGMTDLHLQLLPGPFWRQWIRPQAWLHGDGSIPFAPFARDHAIPLLEWGLNWATASRANHWLILHAAALERQGRVLILPARPHAGKSTLCATLMLRGWRLFSDEMVLVDTESGLIHPVPRPLGLKNASIPLLQSLFPHAVFGPEFPNTRKGTVAHLQPTASSVAAMNQPAPAAWVVAPRWTPHAPPQFREIPLEDRFLRLAGNAFNFEIQGSAGFQAVDLLVQTCTFHDFTYGDVLEAATLLEGFCTAPTPAPLATPPLEVTPSPSTPRSPQRAPAKILWQVMRHPPLLMELHPLDMDAVVRLARSHAVLARLATRVQKMPLITTPTTRLRHNLTGAAILARERQRAILWEINRVQRAMRGSGIPILLLKGAAYAALGLELAEGRMLADLDLLVAEEQLDQVEARLLARGWRTAKPEPYDQRYYRDWMHELPPLRHPERGTEVDLHHALLPRTSRLYADARPMLADARPIPGWSGVLVPAPWDLLLHASVHLFHDGTLDHALRDLADIDGLARHYQTEAGFWDKVMERARTNGWQRPVHDALRYAVRWMETPIPESVTRTLSREARVGRIRAWLMDRIVCAMVMTDVERRGGAERLAWFLLYVRAHALRMPLRLLLPHLLRQGWRRWALGKRGPTPEAGWPPVPPAHSTTSSN